MYVVWYADECLLNIVVCEYHIDCVCRSGYSSDCTLLEMGWYGPPFKASKYMGMQMQFGKVVVNDHTLCWKAADELVDF
jgi:hypothetical protein